MSDFDYEANIDIDVTDAYKSVTRLSGALKSLQNVTGDSDASIVRAERRLRQYANSMETVEKNSKSTAIQFTRERDQVNKVAREYEKLARSKGKAYANKVLAGDTIGAIKQEVNERIQLEQDVAKAALKERTDLENEVAKQATAARKKMESQEQSRRDAELAGLRKSIQERAAAEDKIAAEYERTWNAAHAENRRRDQQALQKRVADEKRAAAQIAKVWKEAHNQNAIRNAVPAANASGLSLGGADPFDGLRKTKEYSDLMDRSMQGLANQRYAMYDVATSLTAVGLALSGSAIAAAAFGAQYDKAFASVQRTTLLTGQAAEDMRADLVGLSTEIPATFQDLAAITTLGAQMGIANDALEGFTETVSTFAATTDVTVEAAATGFGRLAQLTKTPQSEISNLGSAIYQTGINAVATESEILAVSQQIATAGNLAGFSATEIIALGSALSSLGVAPEQARGAIMRVFGDITSAVSEGGEALTNFAQTAGMSSEAFAAMWTSNPQQALDAYLDGLSRLDKQLVDTTLKQQGFVNVRDRNVLTRLANNMDVYTQALGDTAVAYEENTALAEGAEIQFNNLADTALRMLNALKALATESGFSKVLNSLLKVLIPVVEALGRFVNSPIGGAITAIGISLGLLGGALAAIGAVIFTARAAMLALVTSLRANMKANEGVTLSVRALTRELLIQNAATSAASRNFLALAGSTSVATTRTQAFSSTLASVGKGAGWLLAISAGITLLTKLGEQFQSAETKAEKYFENATPNFDVGGLSNAIKEDTKAFEESGEAISTYASEVETSSQKLAPWAQELERATGAQVALNDTTGVTTTAVRDQTLAVGEATKAWLAQTLATDKNIQDLYRQSEALKGTRFNFQDFLNATLETPGTGGIDYLHQLRDEMYATTGATEQGTLAFVNAIEGLRQMESSARSYDTIVQSQLGTISVQTELTKALGIEVDATGDIMEEGTEAAGDYGDALTDMVDSVISSTAGLYDVQGALYDLGASLYENGNAFDAYSEAGRNNMAAVQDAISAMADASGGNAQVLASNIISMMSNLQMMGVDTSNELSFVGDMLNTLVGDQWNLDFNSAEARKDIAKFIDASIKALQMRAQLERQAIADANASMPSAGVGVGPAGAGAGAKFAPVTSSAALEGINQGIEALKDFRDNIDLSTSTAKKGTNSVSNGFRQAAETARQSGESAKSAGDKSAKGSKKAADAAEKAAKEFRSLKDYADDLKSVFDRTMEIRFGVSIARDTRNNALDAIADQLQGFDDELDSARETVRGFRQDIRDANDEVAQFDATIKSLQADRKVLQYQLSVAVKYGDDLRASEIEGELAKNAADIAEAQTGRAESSEKATQASKDLAAANKDLGVANKNAAAGLKGGTEAARENRAAVRDLVGAYASELQALADSGLSRKELEKRTEELRKDFVAELTQMGLNKEEVKRYDKSFKDFTTTIKNVPRKVTVKGEGDMSPAQRAITAFLEKNKDRTINMKANVKTPKNLVGGTYTPGKISVGGKAASGGTYKPSSVNTSGALNAGEVNTKKLYTPVIGTQSVVKGKKAMVMSTGGSVPQYLASGGETSGLHPGGPQGTDTIPAWLTPGEWVVQKQAVDYYGSDFLSAINSMRFPAYLASGMGSGATSTPSGPSVQLVELMPNQVQQIVRAVSTQISVDGQVLASSVNGSNRNNSVRGSN